MRLALFPVNVQAGEQHYGPVRFQSTDDVSELWTLGPNGKPILVASGPGLVKQGRAMGELFTDGTRAKYRLELADGTVWLSQVAAGCGGCGNPLARWITAPADA